MKKILTVTLACCGLATLPVFAGTTVINFDNLSSGTIVNSQYSGALFSGAEVLSLGGGLNGSFPPHSGNNVVFDYSTGIIQVNAVGSLWSEVGGYITGNHSITLEAYNSANQLLGSVSTGGANYVGAGTGLNPNIFLEVNAANIAYVKFHDSGDSFTLDDFQFTPVPEPSTYVAGALMLLPAGAGLLRMKRARSNG